MTWQEIRDEYHRRTEYLHKIVQGRITEARRALDCLRAIAAASPDLDDGPVRQAETDVVIVTEWGNRMWKVGPEMREHNAWLEQMEEENAAQQPWHMSNFCPGCHHFDGGTVKKNCALQEYNCLYAENWKKKQAAVAERNTHQS